MSESPHAYSRFSHRLNKHRQEGFMVCTFLCVRVCVWLHILKWLQGEGGGADLHWFDMPSIFPSLFFHLLSALPPSFHFLSSHLFSCLSLCASLSPAHSDFAVGTFRYVPPLGHRAWVWLSMLFLWSVYLCLNSPVSDHAHTKAGIFGNIFFSLFILFSI